MIINYAFFAYLTAEAKASIYPISEGFDKGSTARHLKNNDWAYFRYAARRGFEGNAADGSLSDPEPP